MERSVIRDLPWHNPRITLRSIRATGYLTPLSRLRDPLAGEGLYQLLSFFRASRSSDRR
jgi:hypothetical protein